MIDISGTLITLPKMGGTLANPARMSGSIGGKTINIGVNGEDGATFIPHVSADGVISWTNDKELPNPEPVNIKGVKGDKGDKGDRGVQGIQGVQGERGESGQKGEKGDPGEKGGDGRPGKDGYTPVKGTDYFTDSDKSEIVSAVIASLPVYDGSVTTV